MEHFKKRLIHLHQKPLSNKPPKELGEDRDDDASSNSSTSSCSNINNCLPRSEKKDNGVKVPRKRSVCRSKFRHNSLKIFKLGTSIPTSLCKSKEPYNVSSEKTLQLCCEELKSKKNNNKPEKTIQKEHITEQIINSMDSSNKRDLYQKSISLDCSSRTPGKHCLPAIISEIPTKRRRSSVSRSSEDDPKVINQDSYQPKPKFINNRRKTVIGYENDKVGYFYKPVERISPDSTSNAEKDLNRLNNKNNFVTIPLNITLPQSTSITAVPVELPQDLTYQTAKTDYQRENYEKSTYLNQREETVVNSLDNPINLSIKKYDCGSIVTRCREEVTSNKFPEIQHQISRLQNKPIDLQKSVEENVAKSTIQMIYSVIVSPFTVENLLVLNYAYKKLLGIISMKHASIELIKHLQQVLEDLLSYVNAKLFENKSPILRNYTQQIIKYDLERHREMLKEVLPLIKKKCFDHIWMTHLLMVLSGNYPQFLPPPSNPVYLPPKKLDSNPDNKLSTPLNHIYNNSNVKSNFPSDTRYIPPKPQTNKNNKDIRPSINSEKDKSSDLHFSDTVIVKDKSMEVTRGDKVDIKIENDLNKNDLIVEKVTEIKHTKKEPVDKNESKNISLEDLKLFQELLKQEDKNIYNKIVSKINHVKESTKEIITIEDEEDTSKESVKLREILTKQQTNFVKPPKKSKPTPSNAEIVIIDDDNDDKHPISDQNQNYITKNISNLKEPEQKIFVRKDISKNQTTNQYKMKEFPQNTEVSKKRDLRLDINKPAQYEIQLGVPSHQIIESPEVFTPQGRPILLSQSSTSTSASNCRTPENISPIQHSPIDFYKSPDQNMPGITPNWRSWISEERKKGCLDARPSVPRRQSVETISSVGSDYSPTDIDENTVKIKIDSKWYRVKKSVMESIPRGKLCYVREKNYLIRYYDDNQLAQFIQNMNISLVSRVGCDFLKKIRDRVDGYSNDVVIMPYEIPEENEVIQLPDNVTFTKDDYISIPELYVDEMEKVERFVTKDFLGFYKYVTGYQIVNNHHPISFQTFLTMHNTNGIKIFYKKYLLSILENKYE